MTINMESKIEVLAKNVRDGENRQKFYNLAVMVEGEAGNINCTEEVYDAVKLRAVNKLIFSYNDRYKSCRAIAVVPDYGEAGSGPASAGNPGKNPGK